MIDCAKKLNCSEKVTYLGPFHYAQVSNEIEKPPSYQRGVTLACQQILWNLQSCLKVRKSEPLDVFTSFMQQYF